MDAGIDKINGILESFMGINDSELATQIWELSEGKKNSMDFAEAVDDSDLAAFGFSDDLIIELWGCITDARQGRIKWDPGEDFSCDVFMPPSPRKANETKKNIRLSIDFVLVRRRRN